jgi:hypothetical protein
MGYDPDAFRREFSDFLALSELASVSVTDDPRKSDVVLVIDMHMDTPTRSYCKLLSSDLYKQFGSITIVYDESDKPMMFGRGMYVSMPRMFFNRSKHIPIHYWDVPTAVFINEFPHICKNYLVSFRGNCGTHKCRSKIKDIKLEGFYFQDTANMIRDSIETAQMSYVDLIRCSHWTLCPRGHGTASFRLYESLALGTNPIVVSNQFVPPEILKSFCITYLAENRLTANHLSKVCSEALIQTCPVSRKEYAIQFCNGIQAACTTTTNVNVKHCRISRVLWRLFRSFV